MSANSKKLMAAFLLAFPMIIMAAMAVYLLERSRFRDKLRPLVEEDLADFASGRSLVEDRERRIAVIGLYDPGYFRGARDAVIQLMQAENRYLAERDQLSGDENEVDGLAGQLDLLNEQEKIASLSYKLSGSKDALCSATTTNRDRFHQAALLCKRLKLEPDVVEDARKDAVIAWNSAYGWMRWLGLDIQPENPFAVPGHILDENLRASADLESQASAWEGSFEQAAARFERLYQENCSR